MSEPRNITFNLYGKVDLPIWSITHYLDQTTSNYNRIMIIQKMCELSARGFEQKDFLISKQSIDIYNENGIEYGVFKKHIELNLDRKGSNSR